MVMVVCMNVWVASVWCVVVVVSLCFVVCVFFFFLLMRRRPPRSTQSRSSAASDVYKRQGETVVEILEMGADNRSAERMTITLREV